MAQMDAQLAQIMLARGWVDAEALASACADLAGRRSAGEPVELISVLRERGLLDDTQLSELAIALASGVGLEDAGELTPRAAEALETTRSVIAAPMEAGVLVGRTLDDEFLLREVIGRGGMGAVYLAEQPRLRRRCAIKVLPPALDANPQLRARFDREALTTAQIVHPNVVQIYDVGRDENLDIGYLALEYVDGQTLAQRLRAEKQLPWPEAVELIRQAAAGVRAAHAQGVIHRDIKPGNLMQTLEGGVKVMDFGLARMTDGSLDGLSHTGQVLGTPSFMAPEQASGEPVGPQADIYSLGATLYALIAGRPPHLADNAAGVLYQIVHQPPASLAKLCPELPVAVVAVIERAIARKPDDRFSDVDALIAALSGLVGSGGTTLLHPPTAAAASSQWIGALVAVGLLAVAGALLARRPPAPADSDQPASSASASDASRSAPASSSRRPPKPPPRPRPPHEDLGKLPPLELRRLPSRMPRWVAHELRPIIHAIGGGEFAKAGALITVLAQHQDKAMRHAVPWLRDQLSLAVDAYLDAAEEALDKGDPERARALLRTASDGADADNDKLKRLRQQLRD